MLSNLYEEFIMIIREKSFKAWFFKHFDQQQMEYIAVFGAKGGWPGLTHYAETCKLYNKFKKEIWEMLLADTEASGNNSVFEFMLRFRTVKNIGGYMEWPPGSRAHRGQDE